MNTPLPVLPFAPLGFEDDKPIPAKELAQQYTSAAVRVLVHVATNPMEDASDRVKAANSLLDRGWGKPEETVKSDVNNRIEIIAPWMNPTRLNYQTVEVIESTPTAGHLSAPPKPLEDLQAIAQARQEHESAQYAAKLKQKEIDARRAGSGPHPAPEIPGRILDPRK